MLIKIMIIHNYFKKIMVYKRENPLNLTKKKKKIMNSIKEFCKNYNSQIIRENLDKKPEFEKSKCKPKNCIIIIRAQ